MALHHSARAHIAKMIASKGGGSTKMPKLFIVRHGETNLNKEDRLRAWSNPPLNEHGEAEAADAGQKLKDKGITSIYSSDLGRAMQTAHAISATTGVPVQPTSGLRPWNVGDMTGQKVQDVLPLMQSLITNHPDTPAPGGEAFNDFKDRFLTTLSQIIAAHPQGNVAVVTHNRGERLINAWLAAGRDNDNIDTNHMTQRGENPGSIQSFTVS